MALEYSARGLSDVGRVRKENQDFFVVDDLINLYLVADGMGGHKGGEVASSKAAEVVHGTISASRQVLERLGADDSQAHRSATQQLVKSAIQAACSEVHALSRDRDGLRGMGTTVVCLVCAGDCAVIGHVGDSRVYLMRAGKVHQLTEDHTLFAAQVKHGTMSPEEISQNRFRGVLTRAVGTQASVQVDTLLVELQPGDQFLLCSDGLHDYVTEKELPRLMSDVDLNSIPPRLLALANDRGGKDNVTAIAVRIEGVPKGGEVGAKMDCLLGLQLFRHLDYKEAASILAVSETRDFPAGGWIVREGETGEEMFVVISGKVTVENRNMPIAELGPGGHFGEMALVQSAPRSATVRAVEPARLLVIGRIPLFEAMRLDPTLAVKLLWSLVQELSQRLRAATSDLSEARIEQVEDARSGKPDVASQLKQTMPFGSIFQPQASPGFEGPGT
jgi:serine/threonine protein phosphatase PrpC